MAAAVMRDHAVAVLQKVQHLAVPVVRTQRPAVREDDGLAATPVLVEDLGAVAGGVEADAQADAQKAQLETQAQQAEQQGKTIDLARAIVTHKADQAKVAHEQGMDKAEHALNVGVAAHKAALDTHSAVLDTAEAMKPEPEPTQTGTTAAKPKKSKTT